MVSISNCTLPKDTSVILPIFTLHRRKDVWGDADEFNPDHFLPENVEKRHPFAFVPFGGGPRNCIGYQYAMFSMKVMLSAILRNFQFSTQLTMSDLELCFDVSLKLKNKHMVRLVHRSWQF
ncbi:probable cytochrome P450 313a4 [Contarinia nasturtii]|uniref:probable cytochrome P450 313a4 n=1 Tax=Contarinia nasturtii TaxID=265458 RepID=UPI0012D399E6|nr:probable cytochrome P450 313a4 [Contarinia nasturtii]